MQIMGISITIVLSLACTLCISVFPTTSSSSDNFLKCFLSETNLSSTSISNVTITKNSSSYASTLQSSAQNLRFLTPSTPKPQVIITPIHKSQIQVAVVCSKRHGMAVRVRSGGHDYEGLSYVSDGSTPFVVIDLAENSRVHGFPAGSCPTVGVGGHFSGGGFDNIFRKYGLAADNVIDAEIVDASGRILNRRSMGEDLFWAIRGGGGASFGVVFAWKVKLVPVPSTVTVFGVQKTLEQGATKLLHKWQTVADKLHEDLFLHALIRVVGANEHSNKIVVVSFECLFLGRVDKLLAMMDKSFPELGVDRGDCIEMSWIDSVLYFANFSTGDSPDILLTKIQNSKTLFKAKSDFVRTPIPETGLEGLWDVVVDDEVALMILTPYGGKMREISDLDTPFPHRNGNLYLIQYVVTWKVDEETERHVSWIRRLYGYMTPYVSKFPRFAYLNYRDLDLGINRNDYTASYAEASVWGLKYFDKNFRRLAEIKTRVDPSNFFRYEQSIPLLGEIFVCGEGTILSCTRGTLNQLDLMPHEQCVINGHP
ncbi:cinnamyl-alcohol dehydrogenase [Sarracenia purpurea var. burkii]